MPAKRKRYACDVRMVAYQVREAEGPPMKSGADLYAAFDKLTASLCWARRLGQVARRAATAMEVMGKGLVFMLSI